MRIFPWLAGTGIFVAGVFQPHPENDTWTIAISGNTHGYLSPCGCTKPMAGGIRRRNSVIQILRKNPNFIYLDAGGFVIGSTRQDVLKAEALAEAAASAGVRAVAATGAEIQLGEGVLGSISRLLKDKFVASTTDLGANVPSAQSLVSGPFLIMSTTAKEPQWSHDRRDFFTELRAAKTANLFPIVMVETHSAAIQLARNADSAGLIVYGSIGSASRDIEKAGDSSLVTPGDKGREILIVTIQDGNVKSVNTIQLGPDVPDDPTTARIFKSYQQRVRSEKLLEQIPKFQTARYAGSKSCSSCHGVTYKNWMKSQHAHALSTLETTGDERDPDCVGCHVTGLESKSGFVSRQQSPAFASVGCESCHGPSYSHVKNPTTKTPESAKKSCAKCHTVDTSPKFDYAEFWKKIQHK